MVAEVNINLLITQQKEKAWKHVHLQLLFRRCFILAQLLDVLFLLNVITQIILLYVMVKNLSMMQETWVRSLGCKDPLEEEMAIHSSILAWRIPWTERGAWQATVHGVMKSWTQLSD